ncbi:efflux RND transporter periplasmic adaptor subunit [Sphingomonas sp. CGMCC 1.13654]|uniref:Efflux RND transporter periplasmic adaptor subunit n=1 Tax=Sphingomonas chungangi TaxID=2683589 RepID=A0A838L7L6_9SPHN|nr:efflux RND transporter periplasmic adaptor subunit [Sphingomonas chungangi]MBA2935017.1 efflux RND transporter periplasmic adaptor subunit [Sphingomonas chungangi]MVW54132.1 efflux RND transporter periplasmic adaptor subunit [Sphingomonas chungangi]
MPFPRLPASMLLTASLLALAGCGGDKKQPPKPTPTVGVIVAQPGSAAMATELPGRTDAFQVSDVRPQVAGIILKRLFTEGGIVHQGQPLYLIDPALYRAAVAQAQGQLASAQATAVAAKLKADRYTDLEKINAVARQDAADARAAAGEAEAAIVQQRANLQTAQINLHYTRVNAPISGRISRSTVTPGALVTASQTDALASITQLDPIYVDIQQSSTQLLALRQAIAKGGAMPDKAAVKLKLEDGTDYPLTGSLEFSEVQVDTSTGAVTLRARFPNPNGLLLPGMYVRAVVSQAVQQNVFRLPEAAVTHDAKGQASVLVVGADGKVASKKVTDNGLSDNQWVVSGGIAAGDKIIVQGSSKAKPGQAVRAVTASDNPAVIDQKPGGQKGAADSKGGQSGAAQ